jgi:signal transduction histidine kinase
MFAKLEALFSSSRVFLFLVTFRWLSSFMAALVLFVLPDETQIATFLPSLWTFLLIILVNLFISLFIRFLNRLVIEHPLVIGIDLVFGAFILAISGGSYSPYYLFALSPLLAGAFFFQVRGAVASATAFTFLYLLADFVAHRIPELPPAESVTLVTHLAGIWLLPMLLAYPAVLLQKIKQAHDELALARDQLAAEHKHLAAAHQRLRIIHDLTVLLQASPDIDSVQKCVLDTMTTRLGFQRVLMALVDPMHEELGHWVLSPDHSSFPATEALPLHEENGELCRAILYNRPFITATEALLISHPQLDTWLKSRRWYVHPLWLREHAVGVLLVELDMDEEMSGERKEMLTMVANQAAIALGNIILCIDRARRLAVETERNRIARELHDTVAQSLFGIVYSLDACINMLPERVDKVKEELMELRTLASNTHNEVRQSILDMWPSTLTLELFESDLRSYVAACSARPFDIVFEHNGDFERLPAGLRRTLYRIAQEALTNAARHSGANAATLSLTITKDLVSMVVTDKGRGFDPAPILARSRDREHFGLRGIQERAHALGGHCHIQSCVGAGTAITITLPIHRR